ncbi:MAG: MFS transporter [Caulobacteraceae bacterium]
MAETTMDAAGAGEPSLPARHVAAVAVGNALQFYDFLTYAFFAAQIGRAFFPSHNPASSLLASLATFGAGFLTRPVGGVVIGMMGDRLGRKPAMLLSFTLMGASILGLALTPSYAAIGVAAPILVIGFRLVQGFALGGEVGPSTAFLIEAAPPLKRGLYVSFQYMTQDAAILCAGLVGVALANLLSPAQVDAWGWRLAFLIGAIIVPFGLMLRRGLPETLEAAGQAKGPPIALRPYLRVAALGLLVFASAMVANYVMAYMTTFAGATLHMPANLAFGATVVLGACGVLFDPVGGWLSDRFGRKRVMLWPWMFLLAAAVPAFWVLVHFRSAASLFGAVAILEIPLCISASSVLIAITESLPAQIRSGAVATLYALAVAVFGGTTQFAVAALTAATGNLLAPAWYLAAAVAVGLIAMLMLAETAPAHRRRA